MLGINTVNHSKRNCLILAAIVKRVKGQRGQRESKENVECKSIIMIM